MEKRLPDQWFLAINQDFAGEFQEHTMPAMSERKLRAWEEAGLVDAATAARIRQWEAAHARPLGLWAVIGIAALSIGLGIVSVVAANWEDIPGLVRLALHLVLLAGLAAFIGLKGQGIAQRQPWLHEAALFVFAVLGMTFFGHVGQVYQTGSPLWQPLALWLLLFAPLLMGQGLGWPTAALVMGVLVFTIWNHVIEDGHGSAGMLDTIRWALEIGAPMLIAGLGAAMRETSSRLDFWRRVEQLALAYPVGGASVLVIISAFDHWPDNADSEQALLGLFVLALMAWATAAWVLRVKRDPSGRATAGVLAGCGIIGLAAWPLSGSDVVMGLMFITLWTGIAAAALDAGWRGVFQLAVAAVAFRLIVLSFELAGDLLTSGAGLIASGLLILGVAWVAMRVSRQFAPQKEEA
jgi:uncharacterized membrane protein